MAKRIKAPDVAPPNKSGVPRILVPGGIGDIYWIMVKMKAFCRREGIKDKPRIFVLSDKKAWETSRNRSLPFIRMIPFVQMEDDPMVEMFPEGADEKELRKFYNDLSTKFNLGVIPGFMGYEYLMCYNGIINTGRWLEEVDDLECDWYLPLRISQEQSTAMEACSLTYGKYVVFFFSMVGDFLLKNMAQFSLSKMAESINRFIGHTGLTPVFIGAWWDLNWPVDGWKDQLPILISKVPGAVNLVGKTTLDQAFGILRGAELVSGYHCGLTNMAIMFERPTVLLWASGRFPMSTPFAVAPPKTRGTTYIPLMTEDLTVDRYTKVMVDIYEKDAK